MKVERQGKGVAEEELHHDGLVHHLAAARHLASQGLADEVIEGMMRGMYTRTSIRALIAEARATTVSGHRDARDIAPAR